MDLIPSFRFNVLFFEQGAVPNPIDVRFRRVSGLSAEIVTRTVEEGGLNLYTHRLPERVSYGNLVLERGLVVGSPLVLQFRQAMSLFRFRPSNVLVSVLDEDAKPLAAWLFLKAWPVRWATSDLDADREELIVDTLELAYTQVQQMRI